MNIKKWLIKLLPIPRLPQKRYLVLAGLVIYYALKVYVWYTPTTEDDAFPDEVRVFAVNLLGDDGDMPY